MEYGTAKVDELEKNGSSIVEKASFSRGERFSAIRGSGAWCHANICCTTRARTVQNSDGKCICPLPLASLPA